MSLPEPGLSALPFQLSDERSLVTSSATLSSGPFEAALKVASIPLSHGGAETQQRWPRKAQVVENGSVRGGAGTRTTKGGLSHQQAPSVGVRVQEDTLAGP